MRRNIRTPRKLPRRMKKLPIVWKRLVSPQGKTCDRCGATDREMRRAVNTLRKVLRPLGIEPTLKTQTISPASFRAAPAESNRVWIAGKPMEDWLGANVGQSQCCSVCGDSPCRTMQVGDRVFEAIPEKLFIRAALAAVVASLS